MKECSLSLRPHSQCHTTYGCLHMQVNTDAPVRTRTGVLQNFLCLALAKFPKSKICEKNTHTRRSPDELVNLLLPTWEKTCKFIKEEHIILFQIVQIKESLNGHRKTRN